MIENRQAGVIQRAVAVEIIRKNSWGEAFNSASRRGFVLKKINILGVPPLPPLLKALTGAGFAKMGRKILSL